MSDERGRKVAIAAKVDRAERRRIMAAAECEGTTASRLIGRAAAREAARVLAGAGLGAEIAKSAEAREEA